MSYKTPSQPICGSIVESFNPNSQEFAVMKKLRDLCQVLVVASALIVPAIGRADDDPSFQQLSAQWWQWALSIPTATNPLVDSDGANCMLGQRGPIWFLAGDFGGSVTRHCSVPEGVQFYFPIVNNVQANTPNACGQGAALSVADIRNNVAGFINSITATTVTLDSVAVPGVRRVKSDPFVTALPSDNLMGCAPGIYSPSADDGYYVKVRALRAGTHTLQFTATGGGGFSLNVTYVLNVLPVSLR
jgi:hypothetical protein